MNIGIIGLGLMGGSLGRAILRRTEHKVYGKDISSEVTLKAELLESISCEMCDDDLKTIDVLCIAVYPRNFETVLNRVLDKLKDGATVIDLAGTKRIVTTAMDRAREKRPSISFVATHPMAGREFWGIEHSTANLFDKASLLMVPVHTDIAALTRIKQLFLDVGVANVVMTDAETHDRIIAYTSQLAHIVSSSFVKSPTAELHDGYSAGSFRDLTRVARLNSVMWTELMTDNSDNLVPEIDEIIKNLEDYRNALAQKDQTELVRLLEEGNQRKEMIEKATRAFKKTN